MTRASGVSAVAAIAFVATLAAQSGEPVDQTMMAKIRDEGLNRSQVAALFSTLVDVIGPRLTGSPAHKRPPNSCATRPASSGLTNAHLESWDFGRGWTLDKLTIEMVEPRYMPLLGYAEAWSPSTSGELTVSAVSIACKSADEVDAMSGTLANAAILQQPIVTNFIDTDRLQPTAQPDDTAPTGAPRGSGGAGGGCGPAADAGARGAARQTGAGRQGAGGAARQGGAPSNAQRIDAALKNAHAAVLLKPSRGMHGTVFVQAASRETPGDTLPKIVLAAEHYNIVARLLEQKIPVKIRVNVQARFLDARDSYNVIADIPGTDPALKDQIVMLGGHLDSWHAGTGATDNADGAAASLEAFRILKAIGATAAAHAPSGALERRGGRPARLEGLRARSPRRRRAQGRPRQHGRVLQHRSRQGPDLRLVSREQRGDPADLRRVAGAVQGHGRRAQRQAGDRQHRSPELHRGRHSRLQRRSRITPTTTSACTTRMRTRPSASRTRICSRTRSCSPRFSTTPRCAPTNCRHDLCRARLAPAAPVGRPDLRQALAVLAAPVGRRPFAGAERVMARSRAARVSGLAAAAIAALCLVACGHSAPQRARLDFSLQDMTAHEIALSTFAGKPLVINFWATWCGPCRFEMPQLVKLDEKYRDEGLSIVGISVDDEADGIRKFADQFRVRYPMLVGLDRDDVTKAYGYEGMLPLSVFIRRDGSIAGRAVGLQTDGYWEKRVQALLHP